MLLKYSQAQKRGKLTASGKPQRAPGMMKLTSTMMNVVPRIHRKVIKVASKRPNSTHHHHHRIPAASKRHELRPVAAVDPCDNSNDSGLGFDHHTDYSAVASQRPQLGVPDRDVCWTDDRPDTKRRRLDIKLESDDANDYTFLGSVQQRAPSQALCSVLGNLAGRGPQLPQGPLTLTSQLGSVSRNGRIQLQIIAQPEQQHRARYQTEGSRGAVKDRSGNGFPVVKLSGFNRPARLQIFIGTDQGKVAPHMFYQACRVAGKNSTPSVETKVDGTILIEVDIEPSNDMVVTCDCVGILKERNVDVEHRFPEEGTSRSRKKSTRCRMVFRTIIAHPDGSFEALQAASQPIVCTQPPGIPEICKKSLTSCPASGGVELYILGKNFLKDTKVVFHEEDSDESGSDSEWQKTVQPDKEFLQQSHLICTVPPYKRESITVPVQVKLSVMSSGKSSEPQVFVYTPVNRPAPLPVPVNPPLSPSATPALSPEKSHQSSPLSQSGDEVHPVMLWPSPLADAASAQQSVSGQKTDLGGMPPPPPIISMCVRRPSMQMIVPEPVCQEDLKRELSDTISESMSDSSITSNQDRAVSISGSSGLVSDLSSSSGHVSDLSNSSGLVSDLSASQTPPMTGLHQFVSDHMSQSSLSSISVENYLSGLEDRSAAMYAAQKEEIKQQIISEMSSTSNVPLISNEPLSPVRTSTPIVIKQQQPTFDESQILTSVPDTISRTVSPMLIETQTSSFSTLAESRLPTNTSTCLTEMIVARNTSTDLSPPMVSHGTRNVSLTDIVSSSLIVPSSTERLDAFVNSAADSHMSTGSNSSITKFSPIQSSPICIPPSSVSGNDLAIPQNLIHQKSTTVTSQMAPPLEIQDPLPSTSIEETSLKNLLSRPLANMCAAQQEAAISQNIHLVSQSTDSKISSSSVNISQSSLQMVSTQQSLQILSSQQQTFSPSPASLQMTSSQQPTFSSPQPGLQMTSQQEQAYSTSQPSLQMTSSQQPNFSSPQPSLQMTSPQEQAYSTSQSHLHMAPAQQHIYTSSQPSLQMTSPQQQGFSSSQQNIQMLSTQEQGFSSPTSSFTSSPLLQPNLIPDVGQVKTETKDQFALMQEISSISSSECPVGVPVHQSSPSVVSLCETVIPPSTGGLHQTVVAPSSLSQPMSTVQPATSSPDYATVQTTLQGSSLTETLHTPGTSSIPSASETLPPVKKNEEGMQLGTGIQELTQMSENDLLSYINPSCFDQV